MRVLAGPTNASHRLNKKKGLIYNNKNPDQSAEYGPSISYYLFNRNNPRQALTYSQSSENNWTVSPPQRKEESAFFKDAVLIQHHLAMPQPLKVRRRITQAELTQALEAAIPLCLEEPKLARKQEAAYWISPPMTSIPDDIRQKIRELKTKHSDSILSFINRLSTLLDQKDIDRLEKPGGEFNERLQEIRDDFTRAECTQDLKGIKSATNALAILVSDLSTLSTNLYQSQAPDVQKIGAHLTISMIISGLATSCLSTIVALLFLPGFISAITGTIVAIVYGYFKLRHVHQENTCLEKVKEWDQARASLHDVQAEIKNLETQVKQVEESIMDKINAVIQSHNNLVSMVLSMRQQTEQMQQQIEELKAQQSEKADTKPVIESQQENTESKAADPTTKAWDTSTVKRVA